MKGSLGLALRSLIIAQVPQNDIQADDCLAKSYYGTYGSQSVFVPRGDCLFAQFNDNALKKAVINKVPEGTQELVWIQKMAVDSSVAGGHKLEWASGKHWDYLDNALKGEFDLLNGGDALDDTLLGVHEQSRLDVGGGEGAVDADSFAKVLYRTPHASLLALRKYTAATLHLERHLPPFFKPYILPNSPTSGVIPVPSDSVKRVRSLLTHLKHDDTIAEIVKNISVSQMKKDITWLTGENEDSKIESRHSFSKGARIAAQWISERIEDTGAQCELRPFMYGFAPNILCRYPSTVNTTATVLLSAHYDSRGSFGSTRAPGGDDDGSGTIAILAIARTIGRLGITFRSNIELCLFAGEEQGLYGSRAYARDLRQIDANLTIMIQADMLAYHKAGEPPQLGLPDLIGTPEVAELVANISELYSPELEVGFTPACCSDHQSFHEQGFASTQVFERAGPIADPMYHNSGDLSEREGYDLDQVKSIAKVQFATLLHAAGFDLP